MPPDAKLIAIGVFSPFFVPLKVLMMAAVLLALPVAACTSAGCSSRPGLYSHEKKFALPLIIFGSLLAYAGIAFVQFFVLDKMFGFIQSFTPEPAWRPRPTSRRTSSRSCRSTSPSAWPSRCRSW